MMTYFKCILVVLFLASFCPAGFCQGRKDCLHRVINKDNEMGYVSPGKHMVIAPGKYSYCFTKNFCRFAIVATKDHGIVGIDRNEIVLFNVFIFDNGPDPLSDGLFRIVKNGKIGYADGNGNIIIKPEYDCAEQFSGGKARVGKDCKTETRGEHNTWTGGKWFIINRKGNIIKSKQS